MKSPFSFLFRFIKVVGYEPRPTIRITPPQDSSDRRVKVYNFIEAIKVLPTTFTAEEYQSIMSKVNPRLYKSLRETFLVISDDLEKVNGNQRGGARASSRSAEAAEVVEVTPATGANQVASNRGNKRQNSSSGSGSGHSGSKRSQH